MLDWSHQYVRVCVHWIDATLLGEVTEILEIRLREYGQQIARQIIES